MKTGTAPTKFKGLDYTVGAFSVWLVQGNLRLLTQPLMGGPIGNLAVA